ncbi:POK18 protein, partial [Donacobius atricapilla]|nr:POK18 protein [Donacobius atricapilla]
IGLATVQYAFQLFSQEPLNIITNSSYAANVFCLESSYLKHVNNHLLFTGLRTPWTLINSRQHDFYVLHVHSHTGLPGLIAEGNNYADITVMTGVVPNTFAQAKLSHDFFHQNARSLCKQFNLTSSQGHNILLSCPSCHGVAPAPLTEGTNP